MHLVTPHTHTHNNSHTMEDSIHHSPNAHTIQHSPTTHPTEAKSAHELSQGHHSSARIQWARTPECTRRCSCLAQKGPNHDRLHAKEQQKSFQAAAAIVCVCNLAKELRRRSLSQGRVTNNLVCRLVTVLQRATKMLYYKCFPTTPLHNGPRKQRILRTLRSRLCRMLLLLATRQQKQWPHLPALHIFRMRHPHS
jgi:hypothetical protein